MLRDRPYYSQRKRESAPESLGRQPRKISRKEVNKYVGEKSLGRKGVNVKKMCVSMFARSEKACGIRGKTPDCDCQTTFTLSCWLVDKKDCYKVQSV